MDYNTSIQAPRIISIIIIIVIIMQFIESCYHDSTLHKTETKKALKTFKM